VRFQGGCCRSSGPVHWTMEATQHQWARQDIHVYSCSMTLHGPVSVEFSGMSGSSPVTFAFHSRWSVS